MFFNHVIALNAEGLLADHGVTALGLHIQGDSLQLRPTLHPLRSESVQPWKMIRCRNE